LAAPKVFGNPGQQNLSERSFREPRRRGFDDGGFAPGRPDRFTAAAPSGPPAGATVKWFSPEKGFRFVVLGDGSGDAFLHASVVEQSGQDAAALQPGAELRVRIAQGLKGPQVSELLEIDIGKAASSPEPRPGRRPAEGQPLDRKRTRMIGTVKWYSPVKHFGFVAVDSGRQEVFVHVAALQQSGISNLRRPAR
jgi:CspA family cold shock protein